MKHMDLFFFFLVLEFNDEEYVLNVVNLEEIF